MPIPQQKKRRIERRPLADLRPHPSQAAMFTDLSEIEIKALANDIKIRLNFPVEITQDGVIICGHQRVRAAQLLGWESILCWVRDDLEEQGDAAVEARLIEDNFDRRQLSQLAIARCYVQLKKLRRDGWQGDDETKGDLRDHLAHRLAPPTDSRYRRIAGRFQSCGPTKRATTVSPTKT